VFKGNAAYFTSIASTCDGQDTCLPAPATPAPAPATIAAPSGPTTQTATISVTLSLTNVSAAEAALIITNVNGTTTGNGSTLVQQLVSQYESFVETQMSTKTGVFVVPCNIIVTDSNGTSWSTPIPDAVIATYAAKAGVSASICSAAATTTRLYRVQTTTDPAAVKLNGAVIAPASTTSVATVTSTSTTAAASALLTALSTVTTTIQSVTGSTSITISSTTSLGNTYVAPSPPSPPPAQDKNSSAGHAQFLLLLCVAQILVIALTVF